MHVPVARELAFATLGRQCLILPVHFKYFFTTPWYRTHKSSITPHLHSRHKLRQASTTVEGGDHVGSLD